MCQPTNIQIYFILTNDEWKQRAYCLCIYPFTPLVRPPLSFFRAPIFVGVERFEQWNLQSFFIFFFFSLFISSLYVFPFISLYPFHAQTQTQTQIYFFLHFTSSWTMAVKAEKPIQHKGVQCICKMFMNSHWIYFQKKEKNKAQRNFFFPHSNTQTQTLNARWMDEWFGFLCAALYEQNRNGT